MGMKGIRGQKTPPPVVLETRQRVLFMQRILGQYYAKKNYAVSRECGIPTLLEDTDGTIRERIGNPQRADFIAINKNCTKFYFAADASTAEYIRAAIANDETAPYVGIIVLPESPDLSKHKLVPRFLKSCRKRPLGVSVEELLWRMAARNSGYTWTGELESGNAFEHREVVTLDNGL